MSWSKEFVNYEFSVRMKKLGFKDPCMGYWECSLTSRSHEEDGFSGPFGWKEGELSFHRESFENGCEFRDLSNENWLQCGAPTWQSAFRWFREKYDIHSWIKPLIDEVGFVYEYQARIHEEECSVEIIGDFYKIEEAELACLTKLIEIVESKSE